MGPPQLDVLVVGSGDGLLHLENGLAEELGPAHVTRLDKPELSPTEAEAKPGAVVLPIESCSPLVAKKLRETYPEAILVAAVPPARKKDSPHAVPELADAMVTLTPDAATALLDICETLMGSRGRGNGWVPGADLGVDVMDGILSHISHELRTPLTAIHCSVELLANSLEDLAPDLRECMGIAMRNTDQLGKTISDLIDAADIHRGRLPIDIECLDSGRLADDLLASASAVAGAEGLVIESDVEHGLPHVLGDLVRVRQVFANLLDNAVRHSPPGGALRIEFAADDPGFVRTAISDEGPGVPPETLAHVFELFTRTSTARPTSRQGLGLGLALSRDLVQRQGGRLWVQNRPGEGATFCFTLPVFSLPEMLSPMIDCSSDTTVLSFLVVELFGPASGLEEMTRKSVTRECARTLKAMVASTDSVIQGVPGASETGLVFVLSAAPEGSLELVREELAAALEQRPVFRGVVSEPRLATHTVRARLSPGMSVWQAASTAATEVESVLDTFTPEAASAGL
ncbi:MAG: sensor histidine kinase [Actinobacteria bacterium ATB1]|nr:sensor histidine kinase [Actinobacteria bacterium ATB1]